MTPGELRARQRRLGLSDRDLAEEYGANIRTVRRWGSGKAPIPANMRQWFDEYEKARR
jgi:DNA-binding transcriptional regulator YiaG